MRKRSGLLIGVIGAAALLFLGLFLLWPANEAPAPNQSIDVPLADEQAALLNAASSADPEKPTQNNTPPDESKAADGRSEPGPQEASNAVDERIESAETEAMELQDQDKNKALDNDPRPASEETPRGNPKAAQLLDSIKEGGEFGSFDATGETKSAAKENRRRTRRRPANKGKKSKRKSAKISAPDRMKKAGGRPADKMMHMEGMLDTFGFADDMDAKQERAAAPAADPKPRLVKPKPEPKPKPVAEPEPEPEMETETVVQADPAVRRGPRTKMTDTSVDPKSTFSIDVDTGSYTLARARMRQGYPPRKDDVRIEEFVNYFHYDYPEPVDSEFAVAMEAAPDPLSTMPRRHLVRIGVQGKSVKTDERPPAHLTFLVDVSGSMFGPDQLGLVIESLDLVTRNLRPEDTIALVTYSTKADVVMWPAGATERDIISHTIATLEPGGSSALDKGLDLAYEVASTHFVAGHINRVVLLGDGRVNAGQTDPNKLLKSVRFGVEDGVMLSTIGFGAESFNDRMMEQLADRGNGAYYFVDSYREAQKVFGDQLCGTLFTIAKDVKIQVEFNPKSVVRHRLLGYENRELKHQQFRDDTVDAGEIGAGHSVTAIYEVDLTEQLDETIATVSVRYKKPDEGTASELNFQLFTEELISDVREASADFKFAAAVAMYAEIARGTLPSDEARISLVREIAGEGAPRPGEQPDRTEFLALVDETAAFFVN